MKLLTDMNLSPRWVEYLAGEDISSIHWSTVGAFDATDADIMAHAFRSSTIVFTHDLDFSAILAATQGTKPSVIQIRGDAVDPENLARSSLLLSSRRRQILRPAPC